jgi:hypothetical protein
VHEDPLAQQGHKELSASRDPWGSTASQVPQGQQEIQDLRDPKVHEGSKALQVLLESRVQQVHVDPLDQLDWWGPPD